MIDIMGETKLWFPFYARDWLTDSNVRAMLPEERGAYMDALCLQWINPTGLDADPEVLARQLGIREVSKRLLVCLPETADGECRQNPRLEKIRKMQEQRQAKYAEAGRLGARARYGDAIGDASGDANGDASGDASSMSYGDPVASASVSGSGVGKGRGKGGEGQSDSLEREEDAIDKRWAEFKRVYPRRDGGQRWPAARSCFVKHWKKGLQTEHSLVFGEAAAACLIRSAERYAEHCKRRRIIGTSKVMQAATFLNTGGGWLESWGDPTQQKPTPPIPKGR